MSIYQLVLMATTGAKSPGILRKFPGVLIDTSPVDVGVPEAWDPGFGDFMRSSYHYHPKNPDHNSGNPLDVSVCQLSAHRGCRVTASGAYLAKPPHNLTIMTEKIVVKVELRGKTAVGVVFSDGEQGIPDATSLRR